MARSLRRVLGATPSWRRRGAAIALVVAVIVLHGWITQGVMDGLAGAAADRDLPARMEVAYVRQMELTAPPPTAAPAAPPEPPPAAVAPRPRRPKPAKPASAPEPRREAEPVVVADAASAPVAEAPVDVEAAAPAASVTEPSEQVAAAAPPAPAASGGGAPFEWPASTRMSYVLTGNYRGEVSGTAQVEWIRIGSRYQVHVDFVVGPSFAPLITQRSSSDGEITADGLAPRRYDQDIKVLAKNRPRQTILFDAGGVVLANGDVRPSLPGLQDTASQFVQLTYVFSTRPEMLKVGGSVDIPLALPKKVAVFTYDVVEEVTLNTAFGPLTGIHLKPRNPDQKAGSLSVEMWMSPQLRYLPVRLRFEQDAQTYVDLMIAKPPEIQ